MSTKLKSGELSLLKIDIHELVKQICLTDMELFKAIKREEINSFYWTKANKKNKCPNLMMSTKQFNKINLWVQKEILNQVNTTKEVKVLSKFIKLLQCLLDYNNFQSAYAVKAALDSTPIHRLEQLWSRLDKKYKVIWERLSSVFSVENNYQNLRTAIGESKPPLLPFLGVYLSDLTGLDAAYPKINGVDTEIRKNNMKKIYDLLSYYQRFKYDFKQHLGIQEYIHSMEYIEEFENLILDSYFNMSKALEPDSSSKMSDSSFSNTQNIAQTQISDNSPALKKRFSPDLSPSRDHYRVISDHDRGLSTNASPNNNSTVFQSNGLASPSKNLLDDSELLPQNGTKDSLRDSNSTSSNAKITVFGRNSPINAFNQNNGLQKLDTETQSYVQYNDPDILTTNQVFKAVLVGFVKRKIKPKNIICMSGYQRVLAKLFMNQLECYLTFHSPKISKPRCVEDFREEYHANISLIDSNINFESLINDPKLYINLPHESYVLQSVDDDENSWPTLHQWWSCISESIKSANASKAAVRQRQCNLINLDDDYTRL